MRTPVSTLSDRMKAAADAFDEEVAEGTTDELVRGVLDGTLVPTPEEQKAVLASQRSCRWFGLMKRWVEALLSCGLASHLARRQLGQALIDQGQLDEALTVLEALAADPACPPGEGAEAGGLIGRVHKQVYVERQAELGPARRLTLQASIRAYHDVYVTDRAKYTWQGINAVAMILRGQRDGIAVSVGEPPQQIAQAILAAVQDAKEHWDIATAAEACVALGQWADAQAFMEKYVERAGLDSFSASSTLRQLRQVWQLREGGPGGDLLSLLQAAVLSLDPAKAKPGTRQLNAPLSLELGDLQAAETSARERSGLLEKVFGAHGPRSLKWYQLGLERARSVARIETLTGDGFGTGFLVRASELFSPAPNPDPDELVLLTNSHVAGTKGGDALRPGDVVVRFEALDTRRTFGIREVLFESPPDELDVTVARLDDAVTGAVPCPLAPAAEPAFDDATPRKLFVIGHPGGGGLSLSIDDNLQVGWGNPRLHYRTPTRPGSSGSPVFDDAWRLLAIHHSGSEAMPRLDGKHGTYRANEGIWIHAIARATAQAAVGRPAVESSAPAVRPQRRAGIFISYSHQDRRWLDHVTTHLAPLAAAGELETWDDRKIAPGTNWLTAIRDALDRVSVAVLLVSSRFLASDFIRREELPRLLDASRAQGLTIVPLAIGSAHLTAVPALSSLQFANDTSRPLDMLTPAKRDEALVEFAEKVSSILDSSCVSNGLQVMDSVAYQATGLGGTAPSEKRPETFGAIARQGAAGLVAQQGAQTRTLITFEQISRLPTDVRKLFRAYNTSINRNLDRYTEVYAQRGAGGPDARRRTAHKIQEARKDLCSDLNRLLDFLGSLGVYLDDHYLAVRHLCA